MKIILGSESPRRKEILSFFTLPFRQINPDVDEEKIPFEGDPTEYAMNIARQKTVALNQISDQEVILTADTIVYREGKIYSKPQNLEEAFVMLKELSGNDHTVYTGVCVAKGKELWVDSESTVVYFNHLSDAEIHTYHLHTNPLDKAGGYAIQKGGSLIVKRIEGCYYNIMGLPLQTTRRLLLKAGIDLWDYLKTI